jgi:AcrR family transcriptional regulator
MAAPMTVPAKGHRMSRREKAEATYSRLMDAAAAVVGREGYAAASIAKITAQAGIAHGTFYNYFADRQALFGALLPHVGRQMTDGITEALIGLGGGREIARFRAFCDYLAENPGFYRILYEAEVFAPEAHAAHIKRLVEGYRRALERAVARGEIAGFDMAELEAVIYILLGARAYLAMRFISSGPAEVPDAAIRAYAKMIEHGLFSARR